jgi:hypothetical protein
MFYTLLISSTKILRFTSLVYSIDSVNFNIIEYPIETTDTKFSNQKNSGFKSITGIDDNYGGWILLNSSLIRRET